MFMFVLTLRKSKIIPLTGAGITISLSSINFIQYKLWNSLISHKLKQLFNKSPNVVEFIILKV